MVVTHNEVLFSLNRKETLTPASTWMNLDIILSEIHGTQKEKSHIIPLM